MCAEFWRGDRSLPVERWQSGICYGLDCVLPKFLCWCSNPPPCDCIGERVFKKVIKVKQGCKHKALIQQNWYLNKNGKSHQHSLPQREGGCLQDRKRFLTRTPLCWDYDLKLPASRMVRNTCLLFKPPCLWYYIVCGSSSTLRQHPNRENDIIRREFAKSSRHWSQIVKALYIALRVFKRIKSNVCSPQQ